MEDLYINNIGIIFINRKNKYNKNYLNKKDKFNKNKIKNFKKEKKNLINENMIIKNEFNFAMKNWSINHSSSDKILNTFIKEKNKIENIIKNNNKKIEYIDNLITSLI